MTCAAISIASNTAEGAERRSTPEFIRFLNIAKGSAAELRTQFYIAHRIGILDNRKQTELADQLKQISAMLEGLKNSLKN